MNILKYLAHGCWALVALPYYIIREGLQWLWAAGLTLLALPVGIVVYGLFGNRGLFGPYGPFGNAIHEDGSTCMTYTYCDDCGETLYTTARAERRHRRRCKGKR